MNPGGLSGSPTCQRVVFGTSFEAITTAVRKVLSVRGSIAEDDLLAVLVADGIDLGPVPEDMLTDILDEDAELVMPLADERWAWIPALLDGRIFTHRLSALEAEHDVIGFGPDLAPLSMLTEIQTYQRLTDGSPIADVSPFLDGDILAERGVPEMVVGDDDGHAGSARMGHAFEAGDAVVDGEQCIGALLHRQVDDGRCQAIAVHRAVGHDVGKRAGRGAEEGQASQCDDAGGGAVAVVVGHDADAAAGADGLGEQLGRRARAEQARGWQQAGKRVVELVDVLHAAARKQAAA